MNYNEIKEKCPKAFDALVGWYADKGEEISINTDGELCGWLDKSRGYRQLLSPRDLYDFFDEKGVFVSVLSSRDWINRDLHYVFIYEIIDHWAEINRGAFPSRREAENAAFIKAFEILEHRL